MPVTIPLGSPVTLTFGTTYALPGQTVRIMVNQTGGTIEASNDGTNWVAQTLTNGSFETAAAFLRAVTTNATVVAKPA